MLSTTPQRHEHEGRFVFWHYASVQKRLDSIGNGDGEILRGSKKVNVSRGASIKLVIFSDCIRLV